MIYLISAGLISLVFGVLLLFLPSMCKMVCRSCDMTVFDVDKFTADYRMIFGGLLLIVAIFIGGMAFLFPQLSTLHLFWLVSLIFGLLFLVLPEQLAKISVVANRLVFNTDSSLTAYCKIVAVVLVLAGLYILYIAFAFGGR
ncbi:MAG: hypothetical protein KKC80_07835 [Candidatus Margulisbacteria bacterium]|nr:hypothetical protein [Candidatus Margulisiibacteriota bacterium]MBU1617257.1 hypothetical protein [Candidatus Margulisiibacteriota bacterium]